MYGRHLPSPIFTEDRGMDLGDDCAPIRKLWRFASAAQELTNLALIGLQIWRELQRVALRMKGFLWRTAGHTDGEGIAGKQQ